MREPRAAFLALLMLAVCAVQNSCGDESSGAANAVAGGGGEAGVATSAGAAGMGFAGSDPFTADGGLGGSSDSAEGGNAGDPGRSPPQCGDRRIDPGEQCDDGNDQDGDGCSSACTTDACEACLASFGPGCGGCVKSAQHLSTDDDVALCAEVLSCTRKTHCAVSTPDEQFNDPSQACYCGALDLDSCFGTATSAPKTVPDGACRAEIERAVGAAPTPEKIAAAYFDPTAALGAALTRASCEAQYCAVECGAHSSP